MFGPCLGVHLGLRLPRRRFDRRGFSGAIIVYRWTALVVMLLLVGCSSSSTLPTSQRHAIGDLAPAGGAFSANYSGTSTGDGDACLLNNKFSFSGTGSGSFIGRSTESGFLVWGHGQTCNYTGSATLVETLHPRNTVKVGLGPLDTPPCQRILGGGWHFVVGGGTGKFAHATGSGTIKFNCGNPKYTDTWSGTLNF